MVSTKPTLVIIHGGWHTPSLYSKLKTELENAGYEVHIPSHPSMNGARPPTAGLSTDTANMRSYVTDLVNAGKNVVAVLHSYGGQVGSNALYGLGVEARKKEGKPGGVSQLIYVSAFALPEGKAMIDKVREFGHEEYMPLAFDFADDRSSVPRDPMYLIGETPGLTEEEVKDYVNGILRWNGDCMYQPIEKAAWREIPVAYVYCTKDTCVPHDYQKSVVEGLKKEGVEAKTYEIETGHCPNFTATKELAGIIVKNVEGQE